MTVSTVTQQDAPSWLLFWPESHVTAWQHVSNGNKYGNSNDLYRNTGWIKGEKRSNYIIEASQWLKLLLMKSTMKGSTGRSSKSAKPNRRNNAAIWHLLCGIRHWSCNIWHKEKDLAENCLALCIMDENTANYLSEAFVFFSQEAADSSPDLLKGLNKSLLMFFPFYLTHSILLIRWLSKSPREKII